MTDRIDKNLARLFAEISDQPLLPQLEKMTMMNIKKRAARRTLFFAFGSGTMVLAAASATAVIALAGHHQPAASAPGRQSVPTASSATPAPTRTTEFTITADGGSGQFTIPSGLSQYLECHDEGSTYTASAFVQGSDATTIYRWNLSVGPFHGAGTYLPSQAGTTDPSRGASVVLTVVGPAGTPETVAKLQQGSGAPLGSGAGNGTVAVDPGNRGGVMDWSMSGDPQLGNYKLQGVWGCPTAATPDPTTAPTPVPAPSTAPTTVPTPGPAASATRTTAFTLTADGGSGQLTIPSNLSQYLECRERGSTYDASAFVQSSDGTIYRWNLSVGPFHGAGTYLPSRAGTTDPSRGASVVLTVVGPAGAPETVAKLQQGSGAPPGSGAGDGRVAMDPGNRGGSVDWLMSGDPQLGNYKLQGVWGCPTP